MRIQQLSVLANSTSGMALAAALAVSSLAGAADRTPPTKRTNLHVGG